MTATPQSLKPGPEPVPDDRDDTARVASLVRRLLMVPKAEREARLWGMCRDGRTRREVQDLLADRRRLRVFLNRLEDGDGPQESNQDAPTVPMAAVESASVDMPSLALVPPAPEVIGPYKILFQLGQGGMGVVYLAEQLEPVRRQLAVKLVHRSLNDAVSAARFASERQAMARLSHPNIAQIFDAGTTVDGFPYFAMEYVAGGLPITDYCDQYRLTIEERLELFLSVCLGVQHAHQRGIIHRDLKPSNILVAREQDQAMVKVIDFGLAKALDQPLSGDGKLTMGYLAGTPEYMSPESFDDGAHAGLDVRNDVYSLGIILYELLTGCRPYDTQGMNVMALVHHCLENDPPPPSQRLGSSRLVPTTVAQARHLQVSTLRRRLAGELDHVVLKAIAGDRELRYDSVAGLAEDLQRHLRQEPVEAHPPSTRYRMRKFVGRHRTAVVAAVLVFLALVAGGVGTTVGMLQANREAEVAKKALAESEELARFLEDLFQSSEPGNPARNMTSKELLDAGATRIGEGFQDQPEAKARILVTIGNIYRRLALYDPADAVLMESLKLREQTVGVEHPAYGEALQSLGRLRLQQDQFAAAEDYLSLALAIFEQHGWEDQAVDTTYSLAQVANMLGDLEQAEILMRRSLERRQQLHDVDDPRMVHILNSLGVVLLRQDRFEEAEDFIRRAAGIAQTSLGIHHPARARTLRNLSDLYSLQGRWFEAVQVLERALEATKAIYGSDHPQVGEALSELATGYQELGALSQAEDHYLQALKIFESSEGEVSLDLAVALNNLGVFYWRSKRYEDAERFYLQSLEIKEELFEPGNPSLAHAINNLGLVYWKRGQFDEAEAALQRAKTIWQEHLGPDHSLVAWPLWGLAGVYRDQQRYDEAEPLYLRALEIRQKTLPADDPNLLEARRDYAQLLRATGRESLAAELDASSFTPAEPAHSS